jgi:hypothetical protein
MLARASDPYYRTLAPFQTAVASPYTLTLRVTITIAPGTRGSAGNEQAGEKPATGAA